MVWTSRFSGVGAAHRRALYKGAGCSGDDLGRPHIGIANAFSEASPAHSHLRGLAQAVKAGVWQAGGIPFEFGVPSTCGNISIGTEGLKYELPIRDIIAGAIEVVASVHLFDGLVMLSSCDNIIPGQLLGAARLDIPSLVVTGGPMLPGRIGSRTVLADDVNDAVFGGLPAGTVTDHDIQALEDAACPTAGACPLMGTANTMQILCEVAGFSLPGTATVPAVASEKSRQAHLAGRRIVDMVRDNRSPSKIVTDAVLRNMITVTLAIGGSTNAVLHILSLARELGLELTLGAFDQMSRTTPCIAAVVPNGPHSVIDLHLAGGVLQVMRNLAQLLDLDTETAAGQTWAEAVGDHVIRACDVLRTVDDPLRPEGGLAVLHGSLAPRGAVVRQASGPGFRFSGPARVYDGDADAIAGIGRGDVRAGDVVVVRYEGPRGAPGMKELMAQTALSGRGLSGRTALVTDGRFSGFNEWPVAGHISPEAWVGGPLAVVRDGDEILVDIPARRIELLVDPDEISWRSARWQRPEPKTPVGFLAAYARLARGAEEGAAVQEDLRAREG